MRATFHGNGYPPTDTACNTRLTEIYPVMPSLPYHSCGDVPKQRHRILDDHRIEIISKVCTENITLFNSFFSRAASIEGSDGKHGNSDLISKLEETLFGGLEDGFANALSYASFMLLGGALGSHQAASLAGSCDSAQEIIADYQTAHDGELQQVRMEALMMLFNGSNRDGMIYRQARLAAKCVLCDFERASWDRQKLREDQGKQFHHPTAFEHDPNTPVEPLALWEKRIIAEIATTTRIVPRGESAGNLLERVKVYAGYLESAFVNHSSDCEQSAFNMLERLGQCRLVFTEFQVQAIATALIE